MKYLFCHYRIQKFPSCQVTDFPPFPIWLSACVRVWGFFLISTFELQENPECNPDFSRSTEILKWNKGKVVFMLQLLKFTVEHLCRGLHSESIREVDSCG